jgi:hypothetical protein
VPRTLAAVEISILRIGEMKMGDYMVFECEVERIDSDGSLMSLEDDVMKAMWAMCGTHVI